MKTNRNIWRVLTLVLALVMLFSIVACGGNGDEEATTDGAADANTTEKKTTEKKTTEKKTTEKKTTEKTTEPPTTEVPAYSVVAPSSSDLDGDGVNEFYTFGNKLPAAFKAEGVIKIAGADHLATDIGVSSAERIKGSGIYHYYIDLSKTDIEDKTKTLTWEFDVAVEGTYDICFDLSMKDSAEQRGTVMQIDGGEKIALDYIVTKEFALAVRDETHGSYMTGLAPVKLTAGKHTIQMTYNPQCTKTFHFRNIYLAATTKYSQSMQSSYDNNKDGTNDFYTFSNFLAPRFASENVIKLAGVDHLASDIGVSTAERIKGSGIFHYYIDLSKTDIDDKTKTLTWEFEIKEAGTYEMCYDLSMKDSAEQRGTVMTIDGANPITMDYIVTKEFATAVRDETHGSYMTGLPRVELTAGKHTIQMTYNPQCTKTYHFRNIYLLKVA